MKYLLGVLPLFVASLFGLAATSSAQTNLPPRVDIQIVTDEADAVLRVLTKIEKSQGVTDEDWENIFSSDGYIRLQQREHAMQRSFENADFKKFVLGGLAARRDALASTLAKWKEVDIGKIAARPLAYLPADARIHAKIYPVIKPRENSFVFGLPDDPAIFVYVNPAESREIFENTLAHELHHIGYGTACPSQKTVKRTNGRNPNLQEVMKWIGAFGEGFAMLAAAGGPDIHPHQYSPIEDRARWDRDLANFNADRQAVEKFFLDLGNGKLSEQEENKTAASFYGIQGPWYTVGWQMAVVIEKTYGRAKLIDTMCDNRTLFKTYNKAVKIYNHRNHTQLSRWSKSLVRMIK